LDSTSRRGTGFFWSKIYNEFGFKPSTKRFPSFSTPKPFVKYDISNCYDEKLVRDFENKAVKAFQEITQPGELFYALDWQHECYWANPRLEFPTQIPWRVDNGDWIISIYPDGDYHFFIAKDFSWGILGHPWENTVTIYGGKLIRCFSAYPPILLQIVL